MTKKSQVTVGQVWMAKVSGTVCRVRVDSIRETEPFYSWNQGFRKLVRPSTTIYECTNLRTGKQIRVHSATRFRSEVV